MIRRAALIAALSLLAACGGPAGAPASSNETATNEAAPPPAPTSGTLRVELTTSAGPIVVALDFDHAPVTAANFLSYADRHRFDGTSFYRAARTRGMAGRGFVQGGIRHDYTRMLAPIAMEPTSRTGLHHSDGTISMARTQEGAGAMGDFFIVVGGAMPDMDAGPRAPGDHQGYAAFGHVVQGMDVVRHILAAPTVADAGRGAMRGQMIAAPVRILSARRAP